MNLLSWLISWFFNVFKHVFGIPVTCDFSQCLKASVFAGGEHHPGVGELHPTTSTREEDTSSKRKGGDGISAIGSLGQRQTDFSGRPSHGRQNCNQLGYKMARSWMHFGVHVWIVCRVCNLPPDQTSSRGWAWVLSKGLDVAARHDEVRRAYRRPTPLGLIFPCFMFQPQPRRLALQHHPDKNPHLQEEAARKFQQITSAYETIMAHLKRPS